MLKRTFDIVVAIIALCLLFPFFLVIAVFIKLHDNGTVFYKQQRVGKNGTDFYIYKFRTMISGADTGSLITLGGRDVRITGIGYFLRKYKLDELPQLINVLNGEMSLVGPRPEVRKYVNLYNTDQLKVLTVKPGITDYASIEYSNENELLEKAQDPEQEYINKIMPAKLMLSRNYIDEKNFLLDLKILIRTVIKVVT